MAPLHPSIVSYSDNVEKPDTDNRQYRVMKLKNNLQVVVISDPETDKAAASLSVNIGHMSDPEDAQGLAHFLEHMLFLGTKKYPGESTYSDFITTHGGVTNAYTSPENTSFYFDVAPDESKEALNIFAQFFLEPLFTESATDRELNAVDSENQKNLQSDAWRTMQLLKSLSSEGHSYSKFGTGNMETLSKIPKSKGINIREELIKFHNKYYSANIMGLAVITKEPLNEMCTYISELFGGIEDRGVERPHWDDHPYGINERGRRVNMVPIKDNRWLSVHWSTPDIDEHWDSKPNHYVSHLIGHEGPGSLLSALKSKDWVNSLCAGGTRGAKGFSFFEVQVDLTIEGMDHMEDIIEMIYEYITMLKSSPPQQWIYEEGRDLNYMNFRFRDIDSPAALVCLLSSSLSQSLYPIEETFSGQYLWKKFDADLITDFISYLKPENMIVLVGSKSFEGKTDRTERWYGVEHSIEKFDESLLQRWSNTQPSELISLPEKNEYIPHNFDLVERETETYILPRIIKDTALTRCWFKQDDEFHLPKGIVTVAVRSPSSTSTPLNTNLTALFLLLLNDSLAEYSYNAELTKLKYSVEHAIYGFDLKVTGYTDKLGVLLETLINSLTTFHQNVNKNKLEIFKEEYVRGLKNFDKSVPTRQADYYLNLLIKEGAFDKAELLDSVDDMNYENLITLIKQLLSRVHLECLVHGNFTVKQAENLVETVEKGLIENSNTKPLSASQKSKLRRIIQLPADCSYVYEAKNDHQPISCVYNHYQLKDTDMHTSMLTSLLVQIIRDPAFNTLRTQEQLGYMVYVGSALNNTVCAMRMVVQSAKHPEYVDSRMEAFISTVKELLENLTEKDYQKHISGLVTTRLQKPKKLRARSSKYWAEIRSEQYIFDRDRIETDHLKTITKSQLIEYFQRNIAVSGLERRKVSVQVLASQHRDKFSAGDDEIDSFKPTGQKPIMIESLHEFKQIMPLYSLPTPVNFKRLTSKL